jgi:hypothetical protein
MVSRRKRKTKGTPTAVGIEDTSTEIKLKRIV